MSLQSYIRQLKPRSEGNINHVDRIQRFLTEAYNIPLATEEDIDAFDTEIDKGNLKKLLKYVKPLIKSTTSADIPLVGGSGEDAKNVKIRGVRSAGKEAEVMKWMEDTFDDIKGIYFGQGKFGEGGRKIHESTQEIMVATLCLMNEKFPDKMSATEANDLINKAKNKYNDVEGASLKPELLEQFNGNYSDLGTAISSANAIRELVGGEKITKAYWTGKSWHEDIKHLNPTVAGIKDYNSSDIVVKAGKKVFYGISLKKKAKSRDTDPTLINKPITGPKSFLKNILEKTEMDEIEKAKHDLFIGIIKSHYKKTAAEMRVINKLPWSKGGRAPKSPNSITRYLKKIPKSVLDSYIKSKDNKFFKKVDDILADKKHAKKFVVDFLKFVLKFDMPNMIKQIGMGEFYFYLLTGIGTQKGDTVVAEIAEVKNLPQVIEVLNDIFTRNKLDLIRTIGKKGKPKLNAYEEGATAAKNFYTITDGGTPILYLEIRYKGEYTANPQFQCNVTVNFKNLFKSKK